MKGRLATLARVGWLCGIGILLGLTATVLSRGIFLFSAGVGAFISAPLACILLYSGMAVGTRLLLGSNKTDRPKLLSSLRLQPPVGDRRLLARLLLGAALAAISLPQLAALLVLQGQDIAEPTRAFIVQTYPNPVWGWAISLWFPVFLVPFVEESVFRGWLQTRLEQVIAPAYAILTAAVLFAAIHWQHWSNPGLFLLPLSLGLLMGWTLHVSGSLWSAIFIHSLWNASAFSVGFLRLRLQPTAGWGFALAAIGGVVLVLVGLRTVATASSRLMSDKVATQTHDQPVSG